MIHSPPISLRWVGPPPPEALAAAWSTHPSLTVDATRRFPTGETEPDVVILTAPDKLTAPEQDALANFVSAGGGILALAGNAQAPLAPLLGAQPEPAGPPAEIRVLFSDRSNPIGLRLPEAFYFQGVFRPLAAVDATTTTMLYADWRYEHRPVLTLRPLGQGAAAVTTLQDFTNPLLSRLLYRVVHHLAGRTRRSETLGIGLLGYAPSVGELHGAGAEATPGLTLRAACDLSEARLAAARREYPEITLYRDAAELAADPAIDLVIIATPPSSHAALTVQMLDAGKHVVCEKPLALTVVETARMRDAAERNGRHLGCHQNRRWDVDYLAIRQAVEEGLIGDLFYVETFVGAYQHPCGFWHSHDAISGGTTYDWGAHYLDWLLALVPGRVTSVVGTRQNRVWHDVTNADQERIQLRFDGGQEVEFIHSDIAAVRKPKWYLLGTEGGIVGNWRDVTTVDVDPIHYFEEHAIPSTEMPPELTLWRRSASGQMISRRLALPPRERFGFHRNLADHLLMGEPIEVPVAHSARVVAVLEAAARSAESGGAVENVNV